MLCRNQSLKNAKYFWSELVLKKILDLTAKFCVLFSLLFFQKPLPAFWNNESKIKNLCAKYAAEQIFTGLVKKSNFEIHFPKTFIFFLKFLSMLPSSIYFKMTNFGNVFMKRDK